MLNTYTKHEDKFAAIKELCDGHIIKNVLIQQDGISIITQTDIEFRFIFETKVYLNVITVEYK